MVDVPYFQQNSKKIEQKPFLNFKHFFQVQQQKPSAYITQQPTTIATTKS